MCRLLTGFSCLNGLMRISMATTPGGKHFFICTRRPNHGVRGHWRMSKRISVTPGTTRRCRQSGSRMAEERCGWSAAVILWGVAAKRTTRFLRGSLNLSFELPLARQFNLHRGLKNRSRATSPTGFLTEKIILSARAFCSMPPYMG